MTEPENDIPAPIDKERPIHVDRIGPTIRGLLELGDHGAVLAVDTAICQAIHHRASDIHFEPWADCLALRFRLDGALHAIAEIPRKFQERIVARIKVLADLVVYQKEVPQDGRIDAHSDRLGRGLRVSTFPTVYGEKTVVRIMDPFSGFTKLGVLGFREEIVADLRRLIFRPSGTLFLTGPSSSGKTTTIYALLREIMETDESSRNVVTIEDPVEYRLGRIAQTQINSSLDFTFQSALRSLLRQDPDVIMVGEIRDADTARTATQAGLTGHLVISTIHSGTSAGVFTRLLDMGVEPFLVASSLTGVLAQRLVRMNCVFCAEPYKPSALLLKQYHLSSKRGRYKRGSGCEKCRGIGCWGRIAVGELITVNEAVSESILTRPVTRKLQQTAMENGMVTMLENGLENVLEGLVALEELAAILPAPDDPADQFWKYANGRPGKTRKAPRKTTAAGRAKTKSGAAKTSARRGR